MHKKQLTKLYAVFSKLNYCKNKMLFWSYRNNLSNNHKSVPSFVTPAPSKHANRHQIGLFILPNFLLSMVVCRSMGTTLVQNLRTRLRLVLPSQNKQ